MKTSVFIFSFLLFTFTSCKKDNIVINYYGPGEVIAAKSGGGSTVDLTKGLVAYYPFNGNANDASGNGNNGTVYSATLTKDRNGRKNSAYSFDGYTTYITIPDAPNLVILGDHTISFWMNTRIRESTQSYFHTVLTKRSASIISYEVALYFDGGNDIFRIVDGRIIPPSIQEIIYSEQLSGIDTWKHVTAVCKDKVVTFYINGTATSTPFGNTFTIDSQDADISLIIGSAGGTQYFSGSLDEIRLYNRALNQSEITYLAKN